MEDLFTEVIDEFLQCAGDGLLEEVVEDVLDFLFGSLF